MDSSEHEPSYYEVALTNRQVVIGFVALLACVFTAFLAGVWLGRDAAPDAAEQVAEAAGPDAEARRAGKRMPKLTFFSEPGAAAAAEEEKRGGRKRKGEGRKEGEAQRDGDAAEGADAPDAAETAAADPASETLRRTLEAEMAANRAGDAGAESPAPEREPPPTAATATTAPGAAAPLVPGERVRREPAPAAPSPAPATATKAPAVQPVPAKPAPAPAAKAPVATAPAAAAAAAPSTGAFWIQVYSSSNGPRAREIAANLERSGFGVRVVEAGTTFRVRVGPYANRDLANASAGRLRREQKLDTWVTDQP